MRRSGGILLEVLISLALFIGAALAILRATSQASDSVDRAAILQRAVDLATTRMAELQVGLVTEADLRSEANEPRPEFGAFEFVEAEQRLRIEAVMERSPYEGLTLVELKVLDSERSAVDGGARTIFTLRQLVRLGDAEPDAYELDEMLEGLPQASSSDLGGMDR